MERYPDSFMYYLSRQKRLMLIAAGVGALSFILLKCFFPYPDLFVDSTSYIFWAFHKHEVAYRPIGYPYFLRFIHTINENHLFTVFIQYLLFLLSSLFCFFSIDYLFGLPAKWKPAILLLMLLNPMLLLQTNLISSDTVFCSLTVTWLTLCLWILKKANWWALLLQALVLYCCFEVRFSTMFYPIVAIAVCLLCVGKWGYRIIGTLLTGAVVFFYVQRQKQLNEETVNLSIVSGFSGWQIANNALYCYKHINIDPGDLPSVELQVINRAVIQRIDSIPAIPGEIGVQYIWDKRSPLKVLCLQVMNHYHMGYGAAWIWVSKGYSEYGWYIVRTFPGAFMRYYILPNTIKYFYPDREALTDYNSSGLTRLPDETRQWFSPAIDRLECKVPELQKVVISVFPFLSLLLNVFNVAILFFCSFRMMRGWNAIDKGARSLFFVWALFYFAFMVFSIFATAVNLRFMDPIFILGIIIPTVLWTKFQARDNGKLAGEKSE